MPSIEPSDPTEAPPFVRTWGALYAGVILIALLTLIGIAVFSTWPY